jgi:hypothetical protein
MREPLDDRRWHAIFYVGFDAAEVAYGAPEEFDAYDPLPSLIALSGCEDLGFLPE